MSMKRVISLIVALSMLLTVCGGNAFAAGQTGYSDVDGTGYETAVNILRTLGIMSGYSDGQFHPYSTITRVEMAELAVRLRGITDYGTVVSDEEVQYKDMVGHPKAAVVAYARSLGIVDGGTDGNFYPDDLVTYEQAIKMILGALGYDYYATARAPYPSGYLSVANELKLTSGIGVTVGSYITRGDVAKIACNALTTDMMVEKYYSNNNKVTYEIVEGKNILNTFFDVERIRGVVEENDRTSLYGESSLEAGEVRISGEIFYTGLTNIGDYLGYYVSFYAIDTESRNRRVIISYKVESSRNDYLKLNAEDIDDVSLNPDAYVFEYWKSSNAKSTTEARLSTTPVVIYNGVSLTDFSLADLNPEYGQVTLMDTDGDRLYDYADVISYNVMTVLNASSVSGSISAYPLYNSGVRSVQLKVDEEDEDLYTIRIVDGSGNALSLDDIKKNSVLFVALSKDDGSTVRTAIVSNDSITGKVTSINEDNQYKINGQYYEAIKYMDGSISVGDNGTFFLTHDGRIAGFDGEQKVSKNIGMYVASNHGKMSEGGDVVKIFKADGTFGIYNLAADVNLNGVNVRGSDLFAQIVDEDNPLFGKRLPDSTRAGKTIAEPARAGILFKVNNDNEIEEIVMNDKPNDSATVWEYNELPTGDYSTNELHGVVQRGRNSGWVHSWDSDSSIIDFNNRHNDSTRKVTGSAAEINNEDDTLYYDRNNRCFQRGGLPTYVTDSTILLLYGEDNLMTDDSQAYSVQSCSQIGDNQYYQYHEFYFYYYGNSEYPEFAVCFDDYTVHARPSSSSSGGLSGNVSITSWDHDYQALGGRFKSVRIVDRIVEEYDDDDNIQYRMYYWVDGTTWDNILYTDNLRFRNGNAGTMWRRGDFVRMVYCNDNNDRTYGGIGAIQSIFDTSWNDPVDDEIDGGFNSRQRYKFPIGFYGILGNSYYKNIRQLYYIGRVTGINATKYFTTLSLDNGIEHTSSNDGRYLEDEIIAGSCYKLQYNSRGYISGVETVGTDSLSENQLVLIHRQGQIRQYKYMNMIESFILYEYDDIAEDDELRDYYAFIYPDEEW